MVRFLKGGRYGWAIQAEVIGRVALRHYSALRAALSPRPRW